jgi:hypothetical protein
MSHYTNFYQTVLYNPDNYFQVAVSVVAERSQAVTTLEGAEVSPILIAFDRCDVKKALEMGFQQIRILKLRGDGAEGAVDNVEGAEDAEGTEGATTTHRVRKYTIDQFYEMISMIHGLSPYYLTETLLAQYDYTPAVADITKEYSDDFLTYITYVQGKKEIGKFFLSIATNYAGYELITKYSNIGRGINIGMGCV